MSTAVDAHSTPLMSRGMERYVDDRLKMVLLAPGARVVVAGVVFVSVQTEQQPLFKQTCELYEGDPKN